jgi:hypothetical protein
MARKSPSAEVERIRRDLESPNRQALVILFIPSHDKDEEELPDQDQWADAALALFAELFGGATAFQTYAGIYRDKARGRDLRDKPILIESYTGIDNIKDAWRLEKLVGFMKRMGRDTRQAAVAVVINNTFHEVTEY